MFKRNREMPKHEKLNLIPIMDAIFIFIFFLLFSAQFIKIFEIESDAPMVSEVPEDSKKKKDPLNLTVKVLNNSVELRTGLDQKVHAVFYKSSRKYKDDMKKAVISLRRKHPDDNYAIIAPLPVIKYDEIVKVIDIIQTLPKGTFLSLQTEKGKQRFKRIFSQIVLEPLEN